MSIRAMTDPRRKRSRNKPEAPAGHPTNCSCGRYQECSCEPIETVTYTEFGVPCPTCGTLCNSVKTTVTQGKSGGATAEYTPVANSNT
jgi:hypothetical protein